MVTEYSSCNLPSTYGNLKLTVFRTEKEGEEIAVVTGAEIEDIEAPFVRIHSQCFTSEIVGSLRCDCREQLVYALGRVGDPSEFGVLIYLQQEGRGIGLGNKVKAYALQDQGADTLDANLMLGFDADQRDFKVAADVLKAMGIFKVRLNTNNPDKMQALMDNGVEIVELVPSVGNENPHNEKYLRTKAERMGHTQLKGVPMAPLKHVPESVGS